MKRFLLVATALVCALAIVGPANAVLIGSDELVGTKDSAEPANLANELVYAQTLVTWYNGGANPGGDYAINPPLPTAPIPDPVTGGVTFNTNLFNVSTTGYDYLWAKLGPHGALYYIGDLSGSVTGLSTNPFGPTGSGLSHITLFNATQVPEAGTLMLLGFGLAGVGSFRRFLKR